MAIKNQVMNAMAIEISNLIHGRCILVFVQKCKSLAYSTTIPADEQAAARDNVAVTCMHFTYTVTKFLQFRKLLTRN